VKFAIATITSIGVFESLANEKHIRDRWCEKGGGVLSARWICPRMYLPSPHICSVWFLFNADNCSRIYCSPTIICVKKQKQKFVLYWVQLLGKIINNSWCAGSFFEPYLSLCLHKVTSYIITPIMSVTYVQVKCKVNIFEQIKSDLVESESNIS
jgi:hypothetical protein